MKHIRTTICILLLAAAGACNRGGTTTAESDEAAEPQNLLYGINADDYRTESGEIGRGETLGAILGSYGVTAQAIDRLDRAAKEVFPLRNIRAGQKYTVFIHEDSLYASHLDYLAYEVSLTDYVVFGFHDDSVSIRRDTKPMQSIRKAITFVSASGLTPETNISQNLIRKETVITVKYIQ